MICGSERFPGEGNGYSLQYSCLRIPWTEKPGGLQFMELQRVRHNWVTNTTLLSLYSSLTRTITCQSYPIIIKLADSTSLCLNLLSMFSYQVLEMQLYIQSYSYLLKKAMAPHSSTLAWKIPWTEEPGGLQFMGSLRVGHD